MAPGVYPRAEFYKFDVPEDSLINIIERVKRENPNFTLPEHVKTPDGNFIELKDGRRDSSDRFYSIYFFYPDSDQILHTWIRSDFSGKTTFALAGINSFKKEWRWKPLNESFWWWKNQSKIEEFENGILNKIEEQLDSNAKK